MAGAGLVLKVCFRKAFFLIFSLGIFAVKGCSSFVSKIFEILAATR